jgi:hypothetical protein
MTGPTKIFLVVVVLVSFIGYTTNSSRNGCVSAEMVVLVFSLLFLQLMFMLSLVISLSLSEILIVLVMFI